jgi:hypothetical protein
MTMTIISSRVVRASIRTVLLGLAGSLLLGAPSAEAIPAFARKYETSCQTCHTMFPKLNAFGMAFRFNGYRMPEETEDMVKDTPISLGAPAYKRLWPHAIWPGSLPGHAPLAINIKFGDVNSSALNDDGTTSQVKNDFQFPQEANLFAGGTLGDRVSFFSELTFGMEPDSSVTTEVEHAHIAFDSPFGPQNLFHLRIGKFTPNVVDVFQEMFITTDAGIDSLFDYNPIGLHGGTGLGAEDVAPPPIALPALVQGAELYGIVKHRVLYVAGIANGIPLPDQFGNNSKDFYGRLDLKLGGMGLDGDMGGREAPEKNWRDNSLRVGLLAYRGNAGGVDFPFTSDAGESINVQDAHFLRTGFFASGYFQDLNVFGAYVHGKDTLRQYDGTSGDFLTAIEPTYDSWFVQGDYVIYPWLLGSARYETVTPADRSVPSVRTGVFSVSGLIRANVKAMLEYQRDLREAKNHSLDAVLRFAF